MGLSFLTIPAGQGTGAELTFLERAASSTYPFAVSVRLSFYRVRPPSSTRVKISWVSEDSSPVKQAISPHVPLSKVNRPPEYLAKGVEWTLRPTAGSLRYTRLASVPALSCSHRPAPPSPSAHSWSG